MKWLSEPINHSPDYFNQCMSHGEYRAEADCPCGITERHTHCKGCGRIVSIGDWGAPPIARYKLKFKKKG